MCYRISVLGMHRAASVKAVLPVRSEAAQYSTVCGNRNGKPTCGAQMQKLG